MTYQWLTERDLVPGRLLGEQTTRFLPGALSSSSYYRLCLVICSEPYYAKPKRHGAKKTDLWNCTVMWLDDVKVERVYVFVGPRKNQHGSRWKRFA